MAKYTVDVSLFGRKHRTVVNADTDEHAKAIVLEALIKKVRFTEVKRQEDGFDFLKDIFFGKQ